MLLHDMRDIGNRLLMIRKRAGLTQMEAAEKAGLSVRAYADIERGTVNMRVETLLQICQALYVTPNDLLTKEEETLASQRDELLAHLDTCLPKDQETALRLLSVYLQSLQMD